MKARSTTPPRSKADAYITPPVQRVVRLIRHIAQGDTAENMTATAQALKINRTTLLRLLHTLEHEGFIEKRTSGPGYQVGIDLLSIAAQAFFSQDVVQISLPVVARLAETTGLAAHLSILDGTDILYLLRRAPNVALASNVRVGSRLPAHATTMGRIMLAHKTRAQVEALFHARQLTKFSQHTPGTLGDLLDVIARDKARGIAWSEAFFEANISSAAVVVLDCENAPVAAINVSGPIQAFADPARKQRIEAALKLAGIEVSRRLGWAGADPAPADATAVPA